MPCLLSRSARLKTICRSVSVAFASTSLASAAASAALTRVNSASSRSVSSSASTSPFLTRLLALTFTERITPERSLETSTWVVGWMLPVACTVTTMVWRLAGAVS